MNPRYRPLFEPLQIGPVTTRNRFYQVPHCNGGGYRDPSAVAEMRRIKAEGGWGVVFTEQVELHHSSEITPFIELRLWDDKDIPILARMAQSIHDHEALAGIELAYSGVNGPNLYSREVPMAPTAMPIRTFTNDPVQARAMSKKDIRDLRRWHRNALRRAKTAGYDLVCLYGAHGFGVIQHFMSTITNHRGDEYGGSLENRTRLLRELVSDARDEVGDTMAVTVRLSLHEMLGEQGLSNSEVRDLIGLHADLPDLWDLAHGTWEDCSATSRFSEEAAQSDLVSGIKALTTKPVVGVGRFTSPDVMLKQLKAGTLDLVGCARPSIADPWLPRKIQEGREDDIRECIGCNICITGDMTMSLSRCTQNPTFMEEWRKGWHPEIIASKGESESVLVVGAGPAGLEAARALGQRGYQVVLAEKHTWLGGRVSLESRLPGLGAWSRVRDYRVQQLNRMSNVAIYPDNEVTVEDILAFGSQHVALATGAHWRRDGVARYHVVPITDDASVPVLTPDDLMAGQMPTGRVLVYDDDHYYMGAVLAELAREQGCEVLLVTPSAYVSEWSLNTLEQARIQQRMLELGIETLTNHALVGIGNGVAVCENIYAAPMHTTGISTSPVDNRRTDARDDGLQRRTSVDSVVLVTCRESRTGLYQGMLAQQAQWAEAGIHSVRVIGDAEAPAPIAWANYAGHRYARELDTTLQEDVLPFRREVTELVL